MARAQAERDPLIWARYRGCTWPFFRKKGLGTRLGLYNELTTTFFYEEMVVSDPAFDYASGWVRLVLGIFVLAVLLVSE